MEEAIESSEHEVVFILFKATKCGFGGYELVVDPEALMRQRSMNDPKQQSLNSNYDEYIQELEYLPPQLVGLVTEADYKERMAVLMRLMRSSQGHTVPFAIFGVYFVTGVVLDFIWEWFGFFMVVLPAFAFFVSYYMLEKEFKEEVESLFKGWPNVRSTFHSNVAAKGNVALLEFRVIKRQAEGYL